MTFDEAIPILERGGRVRSLNWKQNMFLTRDTLRDCWSIHFLSSTWWGEKEIISEVHPWTYVTLEEKDLESEWEIFNFENCKEDARAFLEV